MPQKLKMAGDPPPGCLAPWHHVWISLAQNGNRPSGTKRARGLPRTQFECIPKWCKLFLAGPSVFLQCTGSSAYPQTHPGCFPLTAHAGGKKSAFKKNKLSRWQGAIGPSPSQVCDAGSSFYVTSQGDLLPFSQGFVVSALAREKGGRIGPHVQAVRL